MLLTRRMVASLAAMSMVAMLSALDQTVVSTALPHILASLSGAALLGWIFTAYFVGATATGAVQTCGLIVMSDMFPPRDRARWQVINSIGFATASAIGPSVGGFLADNFSWRWIFLLNVPLCVATVAALVYGLSGHQRERKRPSIDW